MQLIWALGVSGTLDGSGVKASFVQTDGDKIAALGPSVFLPYPEALRRKVAACGRWTEQHGGTRRCRLSTLCQRSTCMPEGEPLFSSVTKDCGAWCMQAVQAAVQEFGQRPGVIGFNGQPIAALHPNCLQQVVTFSRDLPGALSERFQSPVVYDFNNLGPRERSIPLIAHYHRALARFAPPDNDYETPIAVIDMGDIAHITALLPATRMISFDAAPGGMLINELMQRCFQRPGDPFGELTQKGEAQNVLVEEWMGLPCFNDPRRRTPLQRADLRPLLNHCMDRLAPLDTLASLAALTSRLLVRQLRELEIQKIVLLGEYAHHQIIATALARHGSIFWAKNLGWETDFMESGQYAYYAARSFAAYEENVTQRSPKSMKASA